MDCFDVAIADNIACITLRRGDALNTMTPAFWRELPEIVRDIDDNAKARVIVIASTGRHFSAGMDLSVFTSSSSIVAGGERGRARANLRAKVLELQKSFNALDRARMPVLAAVQGGCIGAGVDMIAACDCRYATEDAFFVIQEINLGMTADVGTFPRLCHLLPQSALRELAYAGRRLPARRAKELGLISEVFATQAEMLAHVMDVAKDIAGKSPLAVYGSKVMMNYARDHSIADGLDYVATWQAGMYNPESDMLESFNAKNEKREPVYDDLLPVKKGLE